jgi:dihydroorotate dehydrogenase (fumarate)
MPDLSTSYMGLSLRNPLLVASSRLTAKLEDVVKCEKAGAGGVVLKSIFEEQILADSSTVTAQPELLAHSEALDFFSGMGQSYYMNDYLTLIRKAKETVEIPVIASINCISEGAWIDYAKDVEKVGADALELNLFILPADVKQRGLDIEEIYIRTCRRIRKIMDIPVSMKIGPYFSGLAHMISRLSEEGINAIVLFNRFYRPDVDIENLKLKAAPVLSNPEEIGLPLQWIALLSGEIDCDMAASTGVHNAEGVIKQLLVGAQAVQLCSALYNHGVEYIREILSGIEDWMTRHKYDRIEDFRGKFCQEESEHPEVYERSQYIKALTGIS